MAPQEAVILVQIHFKALPIVVPLCWSFLVLARFECIQIRNSHCLVDGPVSHQFDLLVIIVLSYHDFCDQVSHSVSNSA